MGADGDVDAVKLLLQLLQPDVPADADVGADLDAQGQDGVDLGVQLLPGEAVAGDAVAQHAAQLAALLENGDLMAHQGQVIGAAEAAGAAAHDGHGLAGGRGAGGIGHHACVVHGVPLQAPDVDGIVDHIPAAAGLAGMLTDVGAGGGHGVVLADQAHGVGVAPGPHQGHVARDIHPRRTQGNAGHGILEACQAPVVLHVLLIVVPEALQAIHHQAGGVPADGAVGGIHNAAGGFLDDADGVHIGGAVQHLGNELGQLPQTDAAGHALAAGLGVAQLQKRQRHFHRAQARRAGGDPALHIAVEALYHGLSPAGGFDVKSAQNSSTPSVR